MLTLKLIRLQWKEQLRSSIWQKNLIINIVLGLLVFYFLAIFAILGFATKEILLEAFPQSDPLTKFNGFLLYFFLADLFIRFYLQELPVLSIQPLLHLPVPKRRLAHYLLQKSLPSFFNFYPLLVFVPVSIRLVSPEMGYLGAIAWLIATYGLVLTNHYLTLYFKRQFTENVGIALGYILILMLVGVFDYLGFWALEDLSILFFGGVFAYPVISWSVSMGLLRLIYVVNFRYLRGRMYVEELHAGNHQTSVKGDLKILDRFGDIGRYLNLELKLLWRHKRTKSILMVTVFFLFYGFIFYGSEVYRDSYGWIIFVGIILSGMFLFNYGQFLLSWESSYFDRLLTVDIDMYRYFLSKMWLFIPSCTLFFVISTIYGFIYGWDIVAVNFACYLYNIGVNLFVFFYLATYNKKRLDLAKGSAFNWQGVGASQFIVAIPAFVGPYLIFLPFSIFDIPYVGLAALGIVGLLGLLSYKVWLRLIVRQFNIKKYPMAAGFRKID